MNTPDWRPHFPFPSIRPIQAKALDFVAKLMADGVDDIFLECPIGTGKSPMAIAIARMLGRGYITTSSIELEDQYMRDFASHGLKQLHAKDHYKCSDLNFDNCKLGYEDCKFSKEDKRKEQELRLGAEYLPGCLRCPYHEARYEFFHSEMGISNAAYLLTCARFLLVLCLSK